MAQFSSSPALILIADDDQSIRILLREFLEAEGYQVIEASNGEQCLDRYAEYRPDIVLLDGVMPVMDGFTCCQKLQALTLEPLEGFPPGASPRMPFPQHPTPVLMITSLEDQASVDQAFAAGATDYVTKPIHWPVLRQRVRRLLQETRVIAELQQQTERERLLGAIQDRIRGSLDLPSVLDTTVVEVRQFLQADRVLLYRLEPDWSGTVVVESVAHPWPSIFGTVIRDPCFAEKHASYYRQGKVRAIANIYEANIAPCHRDLLAQFQVRANLVVPILQGDKLWGLLIAHHCTSPRDWQPSDISLLERLAVQVGIAIQQSELYQQVQRLNVDLEGQVQERTQQLQQSLDFAAVLKRTTDKLRDSLEECHILQTATQELVDVLKVDYCCAVLYQDDYQAATVKYEFTHRDLETALGQVLPVQDAAMIHAQLLRGDAFIAYAQSYSHPSGAVRLSQAPAGGDLACPNLLGHLTAKLLCPILIEPIAAELAEKLDVPTPQYRQRAIGYLAVIHHQERVFSEAEVHLVQQVASQCAIAIRQARLYEAAQTQVETLEQVNRLKDEFLSTVSHELRTPVASMRLAIQMLELSMQQPEKAGRYLQILKTECEREINLINDLLDLQMLDQAIRPSTPRVIDLHTWLNQLVASFQARAAASHQTLHLELPDSLLPLITEPTYIERILAELLHNACKYTPPGEQIRLTVTQQVERIQFQVSNTGVEIPGEEFSRIFDKFYRIPNSDPWKQGGTGLGLALVRKLATHLGGSVSVSSQDGKTNFLVELPLVMNTTPEVLAGTRN